MDTYQRILVGLKSNVSVQNIYQIIKIGGQHTEM